MEGGPALLHCASRGRPRTAARGPHVAWPCWACHLHQGFEGGERSPIVLGREQRAVCPAPGSHFHCGARSGGRRPPPHSISAAGSDAADTHRVLGCSRPLERTGGLLTAVAALACCRASPKRPREPRAMRLSPAAAWPGFRHQERDGRFRQRNRDQAVRLGNYLRPVGARGQGSAQCPQVRASSVCGETLCRRQGRRDPGRTGSGDVPAPFSAGSSEFSTEAHWALRRCHRAPWA